ncbi:MAG: MYXO-CTERM sorting domain-containing protein, partial [Myxococcales bacterium]|nr:MYXO-CTERM sorting domain-containing protein [Myxococcales bacterium]
IRNNLILGAGGAGLAMQPHQAGTPSNLVVVHNTILNTGNPIALRGATGSVVIANNALYTGGGTSIFTNGDTSMLVSVGNVGNGSGPGVSAGVIGDLVMASLDGAPPMNLFPRAGGALDGTGDAAHVATDDFDGNARMGVADVGAYALAAGGPGWEIGEGFKNVDVTPMPGTDGGPADLDASVPGSDAGPVSPGTDAGTSPRADAGTSESGGGGGCSCATGADATGAWPLVIAFFFARRRRR